MSVRQACHDNTFVLNCGFAAHFSKLSNQSALWGAVAKGALVWCDFCLYLARLVVILRKIFVTTIWSLIWPSRSSCSNASHWQTQGGGRQGQMHPPPPQRQKFMKMCHFPRIEIKQQYLMWNLFWIAEQRIRKRNSYDTCFRLEKLFGEYILPPQCPTSIVHSASAYEARWEFSPEIRHRIIIVGAGQVKLGRRGPARPKPAPGSAIFTFLVL